MKIQSSSIVMSSDRRYNSYTYKETMTLSAAASKDAAGAILTLSDESERKSYIEDMKTYQQQQEEKAAQQKKENEQKSAQVIAESIKASKANSGGKLEISDSAKLQMELLKKLFSMLKNKKGISSSDIKYLGAGVLDLRSARYKSESFGASLSAASSGISVGTASGGTLWQKITATSGFTSEYESTTFASAGKVQTEDGRSIDFNIELSMSRAFTSKIDTLTTEEYILTDPLMINLDTNIGTVSDQKFMFDLDSDGEEEEISFAGAGSGFLALDKNGDGVINDGSELFGTASGDGFKDLAAYDEDGNGWIDENDSVFKHLKVWTKDEDGKDVLLDLKQADVGAIYLGKAGTEFSLKDDDNRTNGVLRETGIYLKESSGAVGTINHVDLAI